MRSWLSGWIGPESVYVFTLHKCASSLFSTFLLKNVRGLRHVDYEHQEELGRLKTPIKFATKGHVYGPIRVARLPTNQDPVVGPTTAPEFVAEKLALFMVRDPRDILVSQYYSFGFTHSLSTVPVIRERQETERERIRSMTVDEYALAEAVAKKHQLLALHKAYSACRRGVLTSYEEMIEDFDKFAGKVSRVLQLDSDTLAEVRRRSRPRPAGDYSRGHKRSGRIGQFRTDLEPETIAKLDQTLEEPLRIFGYSAN